jgi:serine protease DegS
VFKLLHYIRWPVTAGALIALTLVTFFPELRDAQQPLGPDFVAELSPHSDNWEGPVSYADAVRKASPSVVNIWTRKPQERKRHPLFDDPLFRLFFNRADIPRQERMQSTLGSGVIVSEEGYLLTNNHVIAGAEEVVVLLQDGREAHASLVGVDRENDLAVLKIDLDNLQAIPIGSPVNARVGDVVLAIGNPFGLAQTVTQGIISATGRHGLGINTYENFIQTDAAINPGNSGGALIDAHGNLLGINTAIPDKTGYSVGIGFAVPADTAIRTLRDIVQFGTVIRGWLGIEAQAITPQIAQHYSLDSTNGLLVTAIYKDGPAHSAGILPGDIVLRINDQRVGNGVRGVQDSMQEIAESRPGEVVSIHIIREGKPQTLEATLTAKPLAG